MAENKLSEIEFEEMQSLYVADQHKDVDSALMASMYPDKLEVELQKKYQQELFDRLTTPATIVVKKVPVGYAYQEDSDQEQQPIQQKPRLSFAEALNERLGRATRKQHIEQNNPFLIARGGKK